MQIAGGGPLPCQSPPDSASPPRQRQDNLPGLADNRPHELTVSGWELEETLARIKRDGGHVQSMETVPRHKALWRLRIRWPA